VLVGPEIASFENIVLDGSRHAGRPEGSRTASEAVAVAPEQERPYRALCGERAHDRVTDLGGPSDQQHATLGGGAHRRVTAPP
jgi:hypothetical protein